MRFGILFMLISLLLVNSESKAAFCTNTYGSVASAICNAPVITQNGACVAGTNAGATACLSGGCAGALSQYFFQFTATSATANITLNSTGISTADLAIMTNGASCPAGSGYTSACPALGASLCIVGCNTSTGAGSVTTTANYLVVGQTYYGMVESATANAGNFNICITSTTAPANDCNGGSTVCSDATFSGNSSGAGTAELSTTADGCLSGEHQSSWFIFSPATSGSICFTINTTVDYDFAIWGPYASGSTAGSICPPTVAPTRCSFDAGAGNTGLSSTEADASEGAVGGNGFVSCLSATAGQVFVMAIDNFTADGTAFTLDWNLSGGATLSCSVLPMEMTSFTGKNTTYGNYLEWVTASEVNTKSFVVERSVDGFVFSSIGEVGAAGNSNSEKYYSFTDETSPAGISYYRLKQVDIDGSFSYTYMVAIRNNQGLTTLNVSQNPVSSSGSFYISSKETSDGRISIYDLQGKLLYENKLSVIPGQNSVPFDFSILPAGYYNAVLSTGDQVVKAKFIKD